jgi:predicted permease
MSGLLRLHSLLRNLFRRDAADRDLDAEVRAHLDLLTQEKLRRGLPPAQARRAAHLDLGGVEQVKEQVRAARSGAGLEIIWQDVRFGARQLRRNPGFTAVAVLTLALGIGGTSSIFTVINAVLLRPLPYRDAESLFVLGEKTPQFFQGSVSYLNYLDWREQNRTFSDMAIWRGGQSLNFQAPDGPRRVVTRQVSAGFFPALGASPLLGRSFLPEEDRLHAAPTVVVSYTFWRESLGGDPGAIGRTITLDGAPYTLLGVLPPGFWFYDARTEAYIPIALSDEWWTKTRDNRAGAFVVARLKPGVPQSQAQSDLDAIAAHLAALYPAANANHVISMTPVLKDVVGTTGATLGLMLGAVGFVLLIACANVANLLLARGTSRRKEIAVRAALGAGRRRIARQLLTESILLSLAGGALGALLAAWGTHALVAAVPGSLPRTEALPVDLRVLGFTLGVTLLVGVIFGLAPALQSLRTDLENSLREGGRGTTSGRHRLQDVLVVAEISLALILLVGSGLTLRSIGKLLRTDPGFDPSQVMTFGVSLPPGRYVTGGQVHRFYRLAEEKVRQIPGVEGVAIIDNLPLRDDSELNVYVAERPKPSPDAMPWTMLYLTGPDYLRVMHVRLLRGRYLDSGDVFNAAPCVVIDEVFAQQFFPGEEPIGRHISFPYPGLEGPREIVGIVGHTKHWGLAADAHAKIRAQVYFPIEQMPEAFYIDARNGLTIALRSPLPPGQLVSAVTAAIHAVDPTLPLHNVQSMNEVVTQSIAAQRFTGLLLSVFAAAALLLAAVGIYGVMAFSVAQRTQEIGIRLALGAQSRGIERLVLRRGMVMALAGVAAGTLGALVLTRFLQSFLFEVSASDPLTFAGVAALLSLVALAACYIPARRAMRVNPIVALRYE